MLMPMYALASHAAHILAMIPPQDFSQHRSAHLGWLLCALGSPPSLHRDQLKGLQRCHAVLLRHVLQGRWEGS